jgi:hypothetical protein
MFTHRLDAAVADKRMDVFTVETEKTADTVEADDSAFDESIHACLGNAKKFGDLVWRQ